MDESFRASFSDKLLKYMAVVELATKRQIKFESVSDVGLPGAPAGFRVDPVYLCVGIVSQTSDTTRFERTIAHEITHGLLIYGLGYCFLTGKDSAPDDIFPHLSLLSFFDLGDNLLLDIDRWHRNPKCLNLNQMKIRNCSRFRMSYRLFITPY